MLQSEDTQVCTVTQGTCVAQDVASRPLIRKLLFLAKRKRDWRLTKSIYMQWEYHHFLLVWSVVTITAFCQMGIQDLIILLDLQQPKAHHREQKCVLLKRKSLFFLLLMSINSQALLRNAKRY